MTFNSIQFLLFFLLFFPLYVGVRGAKHLRLGLIVVASAVFYGWWDWRFLFLIGFTGSVDFVLALLMVRVRSRRWRRALAALSLASGLGTLSIFKYSTFFATEISSALGLLGLHVDLVSHIPSFCLILPVGISFYTFQSLSYTIDVCRGELRPTRNPVHYFAYLMLFPQLVAGPIVRASGLLWHLLDKPDIREDRIWAGLRLCVVGFFKKCLIADNIAIFVDTSFANVLAQTGSLYWWVTMIAFAVQIYCDFSGYSDIARGLIEMMGYSFDLNFNRPFAAVSVRDFWRRWHISLSSWFRDYVYIPLGGSRGGRASAVRNTAITFLLSGLWHGAGWNFVAWGGVHALWLTAERLGGYGRRFEEASGWLKALGLCLAQLQVVIAWVFFRADTMGEAFHILKQMFSFVSSPGIDEAALAFLAIFFVFETISSGRWLRDRAARFRLLEPMGLGVLAACTVLFRGQGHAFIYFQF